MTLPFASLFRGWRAALLLVVVACASPGRAAAECGDHVTVLTPSATRSDGPATGTADLPAAPKPPCSGPNCSRVPDRHAPPPAPAPTSAPEGKEVVQTLGVAGDTDGASSRLSQFISPLPVRRATSIFHPPRLG